MRPKKLYPKNAVLTVAVADIELEAMKRLAAASGQSVSDLAHEKLRQCSLRDAIAFYFPDDVQFWEQQYTQKSTGATQ